MLCILFGKGLPVVQRTEQTVQNNQRITLSKNLVIQLHSTNISEGIIKPKILGLSKGINYVCTMQKFLSRSTLFLLIVVFLQACQDDEKDSPNTNTQFEDLSTFYDNANSLRLEVGYEDGAEPYVNSGFGSNNNFEFTRNNLSALFAGRTNPIAVSTDLLLNEMTAVPNQNKTSYTNAEILALADEYQGLQSSANQGVIFVLFLDGYYNFNGTDQNNVLGVSVGSFVVAVFKPVISAIPGGGVLGGDSRPQVEQAIVVHEVGHALGLVDNGVPVVQDHLDEAHGKHCDNQQCVMYWSNEGPSGASGLFGGASVTEIVFDQDCIQDIANF